jgi:hypothetical protein
MPEDIIHWLGKPYKENNVTKNGKQIKLITYCEVGAIGSSDTTNVIPSRIRGFYFYENRLIGYDYASSWKKDNTDFNDLLIDQIKKGKSSFKDVTKLFGHPR